MKYNLKKRKEVKHLAEKLDLEQRLDLIEARIGIITKGLSTIIGELGNIDDVELAQETRPWDPAKIPWKETNGSKGPYERALDTTNPDFQLMSKEIKEKGGRMRKSGYFYWLFDRSDDVGRKKV